ncbi:MAG: TonB-dependent receptor [Leptospiraceae bacterium]|nr:TonB-dependent receptor [Leptospiraceae bacterium]
MADDSEFKISGNVSLFRDQFLYDQRNDTSLDDYQDTREVSGQVNAFYSTQFFSNQRVTLGTEAFQESLTTPRVGSENRLRRRYAGYAQNDISIQKFIVSPSARFDHDTQFGNFTSPRLGLKWAQDNELIVRASGGYGFRSPSFRELYLFFENPGAGYTINGNPNLRPEISRTANAGVEWNPLDKLSIDVNTFYNDLSDLIQTATVPGSGAATHFEFRNIARAYTTGADIRVSLAPVRFWRFDVGYSFLEARDVSAGRFLEGRSRHRVNAAINFNTRTFQFFVRSVLTGERPFYADEVTRVANLAAPFVSVDAKAEWFVLKNISIYLGGDNLTNAGNATLNPLQPMRIYAGLRYQG